MCFGFERLPNFTPANLRTATGKLSLPNTGSEVEVSESSGQTASEASSPGSESINTTQGELNRSFTFQQEVQFAGPTAAEASHEEPGSPVGLTSGQTSSAPTPEPTEYSLEAFIDRSKVSDFLNNPAEPLDFARSQMINRWNPATSERYDKALKSLLDPQTLEGLSAAERVSLNAELKALGLRVEQGKVLNLTSLPANQAMSGPQLTELLRFNQSVNQYFSSRQSSTMTRAQTEQSIISMPGTDLMDMMAFAQSLPADQQLNVRSLYIHVPRLESIRSQVDQTSELLDDATRRQKEATDAAVIYDQETAVMANQAEAAQAELAEIELGLSGMPTTGSLVSWVEQQQQHGDLAKTQRSFERLGLRLELDSSGQISFKTLDGQSLSEEEFRSRANQALQHKRQGYSSLQQTLSQRGLESTRLHDIVRERNTEVTEISGIHRAKTAELEAEMDLVHKSREALLALKNDPVLWQSLSPQQQELINRLLSQSERSLAAGRSSLERANESLRKAQAESERANSILEQGGQFQKRLKDLLNQMAADLNKLDQLLDKLKAEQSAQELTEVLKQLLEQASQLYASLNLAPRPAEVDVAKLADNWIRDLQELSQLNQDLSQAQEAKSQQTRLITQELLEKLSENADYQAGQLAKLDQHQKDLIEAQLRSSLDDVQQRISQWQS